METLEEGIRVRLSEALVEEFDRKASLHQKGRSQMLRELIKAFTEDRLKIQLTDEEKQAQEATYEH